MPITVENITHAYMPGSANETVALKNLSLTIERGEFYAIIGHTGSGKSTLMQIMAGLMQPARGRVKVDGLDLSDKKQRIKARGLIGMAFQYPEYQLFDETVGKDVAFGPRNMGVGEDEIPARVNEALLLCGLAPEIFSEKSPFDLSGGEKRRAALAGILAIRPSYLLLDEPMAGLDPRGRQEIIAMLNELRTRTGCAIIMISHFMDDVAGCAERIAVMKAGELILEGTPGEIFAHVDKLIEMGLDIPQAAQLALALRARGMPVPDGLFREEDVLRYILEAL